MELVTFRDSIPYSPFVTPRMRLHTRAMSQPTSGNGNGKLSWWLIGLVTTMVLGAAGTTMRSVQNDGERIAVLESQVRDTREVLRAINAKLDKLLDHRRP